VVLVVDPGRHLFVYLHRIRRASRQIPPSMHPSDMHMYENFTNLSVDPFHFTRIIYICNNLFLQIREYFQPNAQRAPVYLNASLLWLVHLMQLVLSVLVWGSA
jgi:hypothetical protein